MNGHFWFIEVSCWSLKLCGKIRVTISIEELDIWTPSQFAQKVIINVHSSKCQVASKLISIKAELCSRSMNLNVIVNVHEWKIECVNLREFRRKKNKRNFLFWFAIAINWNQCEFICEWFMRKLLCVNLMKKKKSLKIDLWRENKICHSSSKCDLLFHFR